jgi:hypothetical protein
MTTHQLTVTTVARGGHRRNAEHQINRVAGGRAGHAVTTPTRS